VSLQQAAGNICAKPAHLHTKHNGCECGWVDRCTTHRKCLQVGLHENCIRDLHEEILNLVKVPTLGSRGSVQTPSVATAARESILNNLSSALSPDASKTLPYLLKDAGILEGLNTLLADYKRLRTDGCREDRSTGASKVQARTIEGAHCTEQRTACESLTRQRSGVASAVTLLRQYCWLALPPAGLSRWRCQAAKKFCCLEQSRVVVPYTAGIHALALQARRDVCKHAGLKDWAQAFLRQEFGCVLDIAIDGIQCDNEPSGDVAMQETPASTKIKKALESTTFTK
jgi:hypothetical protein